MPKKEKGKRTSDITCEIKEPIGYLNEDRNKIFARVSWNDKAPKFDIRKCYNHEGELRLMAGVSLTESEMEELVRLYQEYKSRQVDFDKIFASASGIVQKRQDGHVTKDGFIKLTKR